MRHGNATGGSNYAGVKASDSRANALWGKGKRRYSLLLAIAVVAASVTAGAATTTVEAATSTGFVPQSLRDRAAANPEATFQVIVQSSEARKTGQLQAAVERALKSRPGRARGLKRKFDLIPNVTAEVTGAQLAELAAADGVLAVTEDTPVVANAYGNPQTWASTVGVQWDAPPSGTSYPTIAVVDSGVQGRTDFGSRLRRQVDFTSGTGHELQRRRLRSRHARGRAGGRRERWLHGCRAAQQDRVARRPGRHRDRHGERRDRGV